MFGNIMTAVGRQAAWLLILLGIVMTVFMARPVVNVIRAGSWIETPCVIWASEVKTYKGRKGPIYDIGVRYTYCISGMKFVSERYRFNFDFGSGYEDAAKVVRALPPNKQTVCYVNPANYYESVMMRGLTRGMSIALVPLILVLIGVSLLINQWRGKQRLPDSVLRGCISLLIGVGALSVFLAVGGKDKFIIGITCFFIISGAWVIIGYYRRSKLSPVVTGSLLLREYVTGKWFFLFFGIVVLAGNFLIFKRVIENGINSEVWPMSFGFLAVNFVFFFLISFFLPSRFAPKPRLSLRSGDLRAGGQLDLSWEFDRADRVKRLAIALEGCYEKKDEKSPDTFTDYTLLPYTDDPRQIRSGELTFTLPVKLRPSGRYGSGEVTWKIITEQTTGARGAKPINREYPVVIRGQA